MSWWRRLVHRGVHRRGQPQGGESIHAVTAAARTEQAKAEQARQRAAEVDRFMADFRHAFGLDGESGAHR